MALQDLLNPLLAGLKAVFRPFGKAFDLIGGLFRNVRTTFERGKEFADLLRAELAAWKDFAVSIPFRTGVINLPKAIEQTLELRDQLIKGWESIVDLAKQTRDLIERAGEAPPEEEAAAAVKDIEQSGLRGLLEKFPRLVKGLTKVLEFFTVLTFLFDNLARAFEDLVAVLRAISAIREEAEHGSTIFLQQKNPRKRLALEGGGSIQIRDGLMHS